MTCECQCEHCNPEPYWVVGVDGEDVEADSIEQACVAQLSACRGMTVLNGELTALFEHDEISQDTHDSLQNLLVMIADQQAENLEELVRRAWIEQEAEAGIEQGEE